MKVLLMLLTLTAAVTMASAQTETKASPEEAIKSIIATHQEAMTAFMKKVRALPREKQSEFYQAEYPKTDKTLESLNTIFYANPKNPVILDAITWIARNTRGSGLDAEDFVNLQKNHLDSEKLCDVVMSFAYLQTPEAIAFLTTTSEKSKSRQVRGSALYALATGMKRDKSKAKEHESLIKKIIADYPDLTVGGRNVAQALKTEKEAAEKLAIGNPAPEILGKSVDGKEMKLSDYKGKIVVLDFWGDW